MNSSGSNLPPSFEKHVYDIVTQGGHQPELAGRPPASNITTTYTNEAYSNPQGKNQIHNYSPSATNVYPVHHSGPSNQAAPMNYSLPGPSNNHPIILHNAAPSDSMAGLEPIKTLFQKMWDETNKQVQLEISRTRDQYARTLLEQRASIAAQAQNSAAQLVGQASRRMTAIVEQSQAEAEKLRQMVTGLQEERKVVEMERQKLKEGHTWLEDENRRTRELLKVKENQIGTLMRDWNAARANAEEGEKAREECTRLADENRRLYESIMEKEAHESLAHARTNDVGMVKMIEKCVHLEDDNRRLSDMLKVKEGHVESLTQEWNIANALRMRLLSEKKKLAEELEEAKKVSPTISRTLNTTNSPTHTQALTQDDFRKELRSEFEVRIAKVLADQDRKRKRTQSGEPPNAGSKPKLHNSKSEDAEQILGDALYQDHPGNMKLEVKNG